MRKPRKKTKDIQWFSWDNITNVVGAGFANLKGVEKLELHGEKDIKGTTCDGVVVDEVAFNDTFVQALEGEAKEEKAKNNSFAKAMAASVMEAVNATSLMSKLLPAKPINSQNETIELCNLTNKLGYGYADFTEEEREALKIAHANRPIADLKMLADNITKYKKIFIGKVAILHELLNSIPDYEIHQHELAAYFDHGYSVALKALAKDPGLHFPESLHTYGQLEVESVDKEQGIATILYAPPIAAQYIQVGFTIPGKKETRLQKIRRRVEEDQKKAKG